MTEETAAAASVDPYRDDTLAAALARHEIVLPDEQAAMLDLYISALWDWNEKLNLTRHTTYEKFVVRDLVDSRAIEPFLGAGERVIDVGTGGGVPGVVLKILRPDLKMMLTDTVGKKARAVEHMVHQIGVAADVFLGRAEDLLAARKADTLVVRAVAPLSKLCTWFAPLQKSFDKLLIIKGPSWVDERYEARQKRLLNRWQLRKIDEWPLPGTANSSVLLELKRRDDA